ncbi:hypothetical protein J6590_017750 [Homalodisca vitripennis]|nr:hypothetical protein J6590_017750 [Homalodisca vitripennis]
MRPVVQVVTTKTAHLSCTHLQATFCAQAAQFPAQRSLYYKRGLEVLSCHHCGQGPSPVLRSDVTAELRCGTIGRAVSTPENSLALAGSSSLTDTGRAL